MMILGPVGHMSNTGSIRLRVHGQFYAEGPVRALLKGEYRAIKLEAHGFRLMRMATAVIIMVRVPITVRIISYFRVVIEAMRT